MAEHSFKHYRAHICQVNQNPSSQIYVLMLLLMRFGAKLLHLLKYSSCLKNQQKAQFFSTFVFDPKLLHLPAGYCVIKAHKIHWQ